MIAEGSQIGPYIVATSIGVGGMGEVFRARDPRIGRDVAIKVLPMGFASDPERLRRFEVEARAAGMLSHPNLLTIFDLGVHQGQPYLVSELLEGSTLRTILGVGPDHQISLATRTAIDYAIQIAEGLATAHDKGVLHRDLKPENLFLIADDRVKILDFGLAKLMTADDTEATAARMETQPGSTLGTAGYMSPEQIRGEPVDARSDLFSLGVVLYEMLGGERPFQRPTSPETMTAILREDPRPLSAISKVSPALERIVAHALEKKAGSRFQCARDFAFALRTISDSAIAPVVEAPKAEKKGHPTFQRLTFRRGHVLSARFSPDGSIFYGARWEDKPLELFRCRSGATESRAVGIVDADILGVSRNEELALSLERRFVRFWATSGTLARLASSGEAPRVVAENVEDADWSPDGNDLVIATRSGDRSTIEYPIGSKIFDTGEWLSNPRISPSGEHIAFLQHEIWGDDQGRLVIIDLEGAVVCSSPVYTSTGGCAWAGSSEVWFAASAGGGGTLHALALDGSARELLDLPSSLRLLDADASGRAVVASEQARREIIGGREDAGAERNLSWLDWSLLCDIAPDGKSILLQEQGAAVRGNYTSYLRRMDGSPAVRLGEGYGFGLSRDARWVILQRGSPGQMAAGYELLMIPTGAGATRRIACEPLESITWIWFDPKDGGGLLVLGSRAGENVRLFELAITGDGKLTTVISEELGWPIAIAPDGSAIAAADSEGIVLHSRAGGGARRVPGTLEGDKPLQWCEDGRSLFIHRPSHLKVQVERLDIESGERSHWKDLVLQDPVGILDIHPVTITRDGKSWAYCYRRLLSDLYLIEGLK